MTLTIVLPLLVCLAGILLFALASSATLKEVGRAMMWTGMLVSLWQLSGHQIHF